MADTCPVTGLTKQERVQLEESWKMLIGTTPSDLKDAGITLILWMLDNVPNMRERFTKFQGSSPREALVADEVFRSHTETVMLTLDAVIKSLEEPDKLKQRLSSIVRLHVVQNPPIGTAYFQPFAEKFHLFLRGALGVPPDDPHVKTWTKFLLALCSLVRAEEAGAGGDKCCGIL